MKRCWNDVTGETRCTQTELCASVTLPTTNLRCSSQRSDTEFRGVVPASHSLMNSDILSKKDRQRERKRGVVRGTRYSRAKEEKTQNITLLEGSQASPDRPSGNNTK
jgi:hypothetical protein